MISKGASGQLTDQSLRFSGSKIRLTPFVELPGRDYRSGSLRLGYVEAKLALSCPNDLSESVGVN